MFLTSSKWLPSLPRGPRASSCRDLS
jgi:hypothetical protein